MHTHCYIWCLVQSSEFFPRKLMNDKDALIFHFFFYS